QLDSPAAIGQSRASRCAPPWVAFLIPRLSLTAIGAGIGATVNTQAISKAWQFGHCPRAKFALVRVRPPLGWNHRRLGASRLRVRIKNAAGVHRTCCARATTGQAGAGELPTPAVVAGAGHRSSSGKPLFFPSV